MQILTEQYLFGKKFYQKLTLQLINTCNLLKNKLIKIISIVVCLQNSITKHTVVAYFLAANIEKSEPPLGENWQLSPMTATWKVANIAGNHHPLSLIKMQGSQTKQLISFSPNRKIE